MKYDRRRMCERHRDEVIQLGFHTMDDFVEIRTRTVPTYGAYNTSNAKILIQPLSNSSAQNDIGPHVTRDTRVTLCELNCYTRINLIDVIQMTLSSITSH